MIKKYFGKIAALYARRVDALGLAFFRIAYSIVLLLEVRQLFTFRALIFSEVSTPAYLVNGLLLLWVVALVFLLLGWFTRPAVACNYLIGVFIVWQMPAFKYHFDFVMTTVNFLLLFLPVSVSFSLDRYLKQKRQPEKNLEREVSSLYVWLLVILGIGLVYLDSAINKLGSPMWLSGLGFWLPSSLPQNARTNLSGLLNQEFLVRVIGYGILFFEILFLFLIWFRLLRWILILTGILLHLGIGIAYPIPHFSLLMITLYIPLLPAGIWQKLRQIFGQHKTGYIQEVNLAEDRESKWQPAAKCNGIALFILYVLAGQFMCMLAAPVVQDFAARNRIKSLLTTTQNLFKPFYFVNQKFLGIVSHDIFLDKHFAGYDQIINIGYLDKEDKVIFLPLFTQTGQPGPYSTGRLWTKWAYRITGPNPEREKLTNGIKQFTSFWAQQQNIDLTKAVFLIQVKKIQNINNWEKDFLNRQMQQPWVTAGRVNFRNQQGQITWFPQHNLQKKNSW